MESFYEPNYESGKPIRWRIQRADGEPFILAGIWERRMDDTGPAHWSFAMLTINADEHPLMMRFHKPGDGKRSVVVVPRRTTRAGCMPTARPRRDRCCNRLSRT